MTDARLRSELSAVFGLPDPPAVGLAARLSRSVVLLVAFAVLSVRPVVAQAPAAPLVLMPLLVDQEPVSAPRALTLTIPAEVRPSGQYVTLVPDTDAVSILYVGLVGVEPIPSAVLRDPRMFLLDTRGLPAGRYPFAAVAAGKGGEQARADFAVVIGAPGPPTPVPPGPGPTPPQPDGQLGLIKASRDGLAKINLTAPNKVSQAAKLAAAQRSIASAIAAGAYSAQAAQGKEALAAAILADLRGAQNAAVSAADWQNWASVVSSQVQALYQGGRLASTADWRVALEEVARGLEGG